MEFNKRPLEQADSSVSLQLPREVKKTCSPSDDPNVALTKEERKKIKNQKWRLKKKAERAQNQAERGQKQDSLVHHTNGISSISLSDSTLNQPRPGSHPANTHANGTQNASPFGGPQRASNQPRPGPHPANSRAAGTQNAAPFGGQQQASNQSRPGSYPANSRAAGTQNAAPFGGQQQASNQSRPGTHPANSRAAGTQNAAPFGGQQQASNQPRPGSHPANTRAAGTQNAAPFGGANSNSNKKKKLPPKQGTPNLNSPNLAPNAPKAYPYSHPHSSPFPVAATIPNVAPASSTAIIDSTKKTLGGEGSSFESLEALVTPKTMQAIRMLGFPTMREIQARTIPALLQGKNLRGTAATGSGKTLSFLIPAVDRLRKQGFKKEQGLGVLILSPTRELAMQIMTVLEQFLSNTEKIDQRVEYTRALIMGGTNMNMEANRIRRGVTILVATPGRLMDHLINTAGFRFCDLSCLVVDEADMILSTGFEPQMRQILQILPKNRQSMLFSATRGGKVEALVTEALGTVYHEVDITANKPQRLNTNVKQEFVVCPMFLRFMMLIKLLQENKDGKVMVFFSLCKTVKFYTAALNALGIPASCIHGRMSQNKRSSTFKEFQTTPRMLMLCTDVAARGWDIPKVDLILQVDPPTDASEFVHRVGRAAREEGAVGRAVLFMQPDELGYVHHLQQQHRTTLHRLHVDLEDLPQLQHNVYMGVHNSAELLPMARKCAKIYKKGYMQLKPSHHFVERCVPQMELDVAFGLLQELPPRVAVASIKRTEALIKDHDEGGTRSSVAFGGQSGPLPMGEKYQRPSQGPRSQQRQPTRQRFS